MTTPAPTTHPHTNRLAREKSPYLLQHQHNPVDWQAWGDEAFAEARRLDKPVLLSIGYSTCHWCHVMERESFENEELAKLLNEYFVPIKVDREERPDVDKIYMTFVQATSGQGGWPLNVFLTPDRKPFYGGTYFPPDNRHGRPSFGELLQRIHQLWQTRRAELTNSAAEIHTRLEQANADADAANSIQAAAVLRHAGELFKRTYDPQYGGFGGAPKFPQPSQPLFLLRYVQRFHDDEARDMVLRTCERMAAGGIHDQLGGGFARYSVDAQWLVPHFEKMLYDNAQLTQLYLDAWLVSADPRFDGERLDQAANISLSSPEGGARPAGSTSVVPFEGRGEEVNDLRAQNPSPQPSPRSGGARESTAPRCSLFATVARDILEYVLRDMTHPEGGFYSAEDADSEGYEGKFYCWTRAELSRLLTAEEFAVAARYFGITETGNFVDHSHPQPLPGQNVLSIVDPKLSGNEAALLAAAKEKMLAARAQRIRPHLDDKVLASWNGLMLGAFARAYAVLGEERYRRAAEKNLDFLEAKLWDAKTRTLYHRWRDGERDDVQLLEGYAFLLSGVIDLYEATLEPRRLEFALALAESMLERFYDAENGGFWQSPSTANDLIMRVKDHYDGAEPSGNSMAVLSLLRLGKITERKKFGDAVEKTLRLFASRLEQVPQAVPCLLQALDFSVDEPRRVVVVGDAACPETRALVLAAHSAYQPNKVVLGNRGPVEPFALTLPAQDGACAYVCTGTSCQAPTRDAAALRAALTVE